MIIAVGPGDGGVSYDISYLFREWHSVGVMARLMLVTSDGRMAKSGCARHNSSDPDASSRRTHTIALSAARTALRHRRCCLLGAASVHVELGRGSVGAFWFAVVTGLLNRRATMVVVAHDLPVVVKHPASALVPHRAGWTDAVAYKIVARLLDGPVIALLRRRADVTVVWTDAAARDAEALGWPAVTRVRHGAGPQSSDAPDPSAAGFVLCAGYLAPGKGLDVLANAWCSVETSSMLPLVIAGGNSEVHDSWLAAVRATFSRSEHPPTWLGYVDDDHFERLLRDAAIVVIPYESSNPLSGPLIRALAEGRAVVATRVAAAAEEITDGADGILVEPGNAVELAAALSRLMAGPGLRSRLGAAAARRSAGQHSWSDHVNSLTRLHGLTQTRDPRRAAFAGHEERAP